MDIFSRSIEFKRKPRHFPKAMINKLVVKVFQTQTDLFFNEKFLKQHIFSKCIDEMKVIAEAFFLCFQDRPGKVLRAMLFWLLGVVTTGGLTQWQLTT